MPISNTNGRALEFMIVEHIKNSIPAGKVTLTSRALASQEQDSGKQLLISRDLYQQFAKYSKQIYDWLVNNHDLLTGPVLLDRISDQDAIAGDPTDIRIIVKEKEINLSIKHNNSALKHQRPGRMVEQCGYTKDSIENVQYKEEYRGLLDNFFVKAKIIAPDATEFNELKSLQNDFIDLNLYLPICNLVARTINSICNSEDKAVNLFKFLAGNINYYKISADHGGISIEEFINVKLPKTVEAKVWKNSYVDLIFSNRWEMRMRLHTASRKIKNDLKFDAQLTSKSVVIRSIIELSPEDIEFLTNS